jgi:hypothetical protein
VDECKPLPATRPACTRGTPSAPPARYRRKLNLKATFGSSLPHFSFKRLAPRHFQRRFHRFNLHRLTAHAPTRPPPRTPAPARNRSGTRRRRRGAGGTPGCDPSPAPRRQGIWPKHGRSHSTVKSASSRYSGVTQRERERDASAFMRRQQASLRLAPRVSRRGNSRGQRFQGLNGSIHPSNYTTPYQLWCA